MDSEWNTGNTVQFGQWLKGNVRLLFICTVGQILYLNVYNEELTDATS